jgi:hypothetical protein
MQRFMLFATTLTVFVLTVGCGQEQVVEPRPSAESVDGSQYLLSEEPQDAKDVIVVRESVQDDEAVVVVGRIGGSRDPWVEGRAAFSIVDLSLKACSDIEGDMCKVPWDYCCETDLLPDATVLVKVVDESGSLVDTDSRELLSVKELDTVIVDGTAKRDDAGNLTVLASKLYVKR